MVYKIFIHIRKGKKHEEKIITLILIGACTISALSACLYGLDGQTVDYEAAYSNFEQALEKGKTEANFYLGALYDWFSYPEQDFEKAKSYYEAAGDNPYAKLALGFLYYNGQGIEADAAKAQELFDSAVADGCVEGYLGKAAIAVDEEDWFQKAADLGNATAMEYIGSMYQVGLGADQDLKKANEWFAKAEAAE